MYAGTDKNAYTGIDVNDSKVKDVNEAKVWDCMDTKTWALKLSIDVVLTILKVDQIIMSKPSGGPNMNAPARRPDGYDDGCCP